MNRKIFFAILVLLVCSFLAFNAIGAGQYFRIHGFFIPDDTWTGWHPWKVTFDIGTSNSGFAAGIDSDGYLSGSFWLGNVGWAVFNHLEGSIERAKIVCPDDVFKDVNATCPATGFAWSENAGWIALSGTFINGGSGVYYNPTTGLIEWFWHSKALGYIPFYGYAGSPVDSGTVDQTGITLDGIWVNFIGKIAIIGNIAGTRIYNMTNQNVWYVFNTINHAGILNTIRKNVALISRNVPNTSLASGSGVNFIYQKSPSFDYDTTFAWVWPANERSIIIEWRDVVLNQIEIGDASTTAPRAIIALKDANGNGGNIIITDNVRRIYAFLYAEWSIYSGTKPTTWSPITSYIQSGAWNIPAKQLYVKWWLISKNTIGGSLQTPSMCPVIVANCTNTIAQIYDLNYFRTYDYTDASQKSVPFDDVRFEKSSLIIEYNNNVVSNPPPGLESVAQ